MFATLNLHLRRLASRRIIRSERIDAATLGKTLRFCVRSLPALLNAERCNIFVYDPNSAKAWVEVGTGVTEGEFEVPTKSTLVGEVIASGKSLIANDLRTRPGVHIEIDGAAGFASRNAVYAPVRSRYHSEVVGVIEVLNSRSGSGFTNADLQLVEEAAESIQDLVDSVFLEQDVYGATDELVDASRCTLLTVLGLVLMGSVVTLLLMAAWTAMPIVSEAINPSLAPFVPNAER